jgi:hypothetical protein
MTVNPSAHSEIIGIIVPTVRLSQCSETIDPMTEIASQIPRKDMADINDRNGKQHIVKR